MEKGAGDDEVKKKKEKRLPSGISLAFSCAPFFYLSLSPSPNPVKKNKTNTIFVAKGIKKKTFFLFALFLLPGGCTRRPPLTGILAGVCSSSNSGKGRSRLGLTWVSYGFSLVKGKANHPMEDYHVAKFVQTKGHELRLFAIFDGHVGDTVPAYLQKHLFNNILKEEEFWM